MSKQFVDKIITEVIANGATSEVYKRARQKMDVSGNHLVTVYKKSLARYSKSIDVDKTYSTIHNNAVSKFGADNVNQDATKITVSMPGKYSRDLRLIVEEAVGEAAHFAHKGKTTVGTSILATSSSMANTALAKQASNVNLTTTEGIKVAYDRALAVKAYKQAVYNTLDNIKWGWDSEEVITPSKYLKSLTITGSIVSGPDNKAGAEDLDLSKLKKNHLYAEFAKEFQKLAGESKAIKKLGITSASPSPVTKILSRLINTFLNSITRSSNIKVTRGTKPVKPKKDSGKVKAPKRGGKSTPSRLVLSGELANTKEPVVNLRSLIPVINNSLSAIIAANMGSPRLNYRTGRFASSAEVLDITPTPKGYPSISYTYQKNPYQVFESPGGSPRLATTEREPRQIIDKSIREIATGLIKQRFYTRRV